MMTERKLDGKKLSYRPMTECELSRVERERVYLASSQQEGRRDRHNDLIVEAASRSYMSFEAHARWVVGVCRIGGERIVLDDLAAAGIQAWCPMEHLRTRPRRGLKPVDIYRPYFGGYVFVRVIPGQKAYAGVLAASRIRGFMGRDGRPFVMPEKVMDLLILNAKKDEMDQRDNPKLPIAPGARVSIGKGPFANFLATVRRLIPDRWRAEVEVNLFGRMSVIEIDIDSIEA